MFAAEWPVSVDSVKIKSSPTPEFPQQRCTSILIKSIWYGKDLVLIIYVDDCGISAPTRERIDEFIQGLKDMKFDLTIEDSFEEFLGIKFKTMDDGSVECTQRGLIKKTLEAAGMLDCNPNSTPAVPTALGSYKDSEPMNEKWNYRTIVGMLLCLSGNTRPDIALAVSQVCRFASAPKKPQVSAAKTILRCLKKTMDKGLIIKPTENPFQLDLHVDADFCGCLDKRILETGRV